jgi:hypothetical protein
MHDLLALLSRFFAIPEMTIEPVGPVVAVGPLGAFG